MGVQVPLRAPSECTYAPHVCCLRIHFTLNLVKMSVKIAEPSASFVGIVTPSRHLLLWTVLMSRWLRLEGRASLPHSLHPQLA